MYRSASAVNALKLLSVVLVAVTLNRYFSLESTFLLAVRDPYSDGCHDAFVIAASHYLPAGSAAVMRVRRVYWCGTPLLQCLMKGKHLVSERSLVEEARRLQAQFAPEEARPPEAAILATCRTPGCAGRVDLRDLAAIRLVENRL